VLSDVEVLSERVAIVRQGRISAYGAIDELLRPEVRRVDVELGDVDGALREKLERVARTVKKLDDNITLAVVEGDEEVPALLNVALGAGARVLAVTPHRETLEDLFVRNAVAEHN
jgi:ABC-2 type transport system ATP-binding protein